MEDIIKLIKSLEVSSLLGTTLAGKGINRARKGFIGAGYGSRRFSIKDF